MPSGTHDYDDAGDGTETAEWFKQNSNYDELVSGMDADEREAFANWMSGHFMFGQQWRGWAGMDLDDRYMTYRFDNILDQSRLDKGVVLRRLATAELVLGAGNRMPTSLEELRQLEGRTVLAKGSMSFAAAARGLSIGDPNKKVEYILKIPGGTTGAGMWIGDKRIGWWGARQREFMTNRDVNYTIGKTTYNQSRGVYEVELTYAGRVEHDYEARRSR